MDKLIKCVKCGESISLHNKNNDSDQCKDCVNKINEQVIKINKKKWHKMQKRIKKELEAKGVVYIDFND